MTKEKVEEIVKFIKKRFKDYKWPRDNPYYFATILAGKFPPLEVYYLPIQDTFVAGVKRLYYFTLDGIKLYDEEPYTLFELHTYSDRLYEDLKRRFID